MDSPKLAILFWFYKDVDTCINRLELLRKNNPTIKIHGLYGGEAKNESIFRTELGKYLDSFWSSSSTDVNWKWIHGDLVILDWYEKLGINLDFDSLVIVQWDMLFLDSVENQFENLRKNEMYLSGLRVLDDYTEKNWEWTDPKKEYRKDFEQFFSYVKEKYSYDNKNKPCCLFVLEVIPKKFFDNYLKVEDKELGMLEYKIPVYAEIFGIKTVSRENEAHWWDDVEKYPLNAEPTEIKTEYIQNELKKKNGWRIFHPYFKIWTN